MARWTRWCPPSPKSSRPSRLPNNSRQKMPPSQAILTSVEAPPRHGRYDKRILVTGGAGFIGSNFVRYLMERYPRYRILILDALTYAGSVENLPKINHFDEDAQVVFWYGNVCNAGLVEQLVSEVDYVVHFAAETHVERSIYDNLPFFQTDVLGTQ